MKPSEARGLAQGTVLTEARRTFGGPTRIVVDHIVAGPGSKVRIFDAAGVCWRAADVEHPTPNVQARWATEAEKRRKEDELQAEMRTVLDLFGVSPFRKYDGFRQLDDYTVTLNRAKVLELMQILNLDGRSKR